MVAAGLAQEQPYPAYTGQGLIRTPLLQLPRLDEYRTHCYENEIEVPDFLSVYER